MSIFHITEDRFKKLEAENTTLREQLVAAQKDASDAFWRVRDICKKIACDTQTDRLLWWQQDARLAVEVIDAAIAKEKTE